MERFINKIRFQQLCLFDNLIHFSTTRQGGCSYQNYDSFNLSFFCGDNPDHVTKNREILAQSLHLNPSHIFVPFQTHGTQIEILEKDFLTATQMDQIRILEGKDALLTSQKNACIAVSTADCVPILLFDPDKKVVGAVHAGWRGTCARILEKTIREMMQYYNSDPRNIYAAIGPSIGPESFEVGEEVYESFRENGFNMDAIVFRHPQSNKYHINLWKANVQQLSDLRVPPEQIEVSGICTYTHSDHFFSARKLGIQSGRMLTGICLI